MPLSVVVSQSPSLGFDGPPETEPLRQWYGDLYGPDGWRMWWIVPASRRRRQILREVTATRRLPRVLVLDGLVQYLQGFSRQQFRTVGNTGQLIRIARAWSETHANASPTLGQVKQLQRFISEWAESGAATAATPPHATFLKAYEQIMATDHCVDRGSALSSLADEIEDVNSPLARMLCGRRILFDGFHRFSEPEIDVIQAIGQHADVRVWLASGNADCLSAKRVAASLGIEAIVDTRPAPTTLSQFGRCLFSDAKATTDAIDLIEATSTAAECQSVAVLIKGWMRTSSNTRLADIAIVIPDDSYLPPLTSTLKAARIDCAPVAEVFTLFESRPARALLLALRLIRHGWQAETLFDFLRQPQILECLRNGHLLEWLRQRSPLGAQRNDWKSWKARWKDLCDSLVQAGPGRDEDSDESPAERHERVKLLADDIDELIESIDKVVAPLADLEKALNRKTADKPAGLVAAIARFLDAIHTATRLSPAVHANWTIVAAREWEIDQLAFNNLKDVLAELHDLPGSNLPRDADGHVDVELVLQLALAAETFQTSAEDDAGVQIVRPRAIRGSRFHVVIAMGMVEGKMPPDTGTHRGRQDPSSAVDRLQEEERLEQEYLFAQIFESAAQRVVLSRPLKENDVPLMESPFLRRVREKLGGRIATLVPPTLVAVRDARRFADRPELQQDSEAQRNLARRETWMNRPLPEQLRIELWAMPLLQLRYPKDRPFSATALEKYAACPFQHFTLKTLGLEELERDDAAMRWGSFLHDVLEQFFKESRDAKREPTADGFLVLLRKRWPDVAATLDDTHLHDFETALTGALMSVNAFLKNQGFTQIEAEWERKEVRIPDGAGGQLLLHVKIDRVDRKADGSIEIICDFKTGGVESGGKLRERLASGRRLQLPLYGYARQLETTIPVKHGLYVQLSRKVEASPDQYAQFLVSVGEELDTKKRSGPIAFEPEEAGRIAVGLANDMRGGRIALSTFDVDHTDPACVSYCSARHACRHPKGYRD